MNIPDWLTLHNVYAVAGCLILLAIVIAVAASAVASVESMIHGSVPEPDYIRDNFYPAKLLEVQRRKAAEAIQ
jgi:hypothetical protein